MEDSPPVGDVIRGDSMAVLDSLPADSYHAVVTDPPYAINFMDEEWDQFRRAKNDADADRDGFGGRLSTTSPASGAEGDNYEFHRWTMVWAEKAKRVLKPGGHALVFGGNRTHHRVMAAFEDVGYEIRDTITWHYGEGMPKGARLKTWLDGDDAVEWGDWRGTLKPSTEFITMARSPLGESSATRNQVEHGVGNLNVEAARLPTSDDIPNADRDGEPTAEDRYDGDGPIKFHQKPGPRGGDGDGRYPPNLVLDPVMGDVMDLQSGDRPCGYMGPEHTDTGNADGLYGNFEGRSPDATYADSGGASRFFYCPKASTSERTHDGEVENDHPTVKPLGLMRWLVRLVTAEGQRVLDPFAGSGTTALACEEEGREWCAIELDEDYVDIARSRVGVALGD